MKISVLTVTKRTGWGKNAAESILKQTLLPHEWIIISEGNADKIKDEIDQAQFWNKCSTMVKNAPEKIRLSNLNRSLNDGLKYCHGDYVIFYQDFINLPENCFEKLVELASADERTFVTTATINDDGKMDGRYLGVDKPHTCIPAEWEANVAIAPMKIIKELGGFDEEYDNGWSWDNVNLAERAAMLGCKFIIDESNKPQLLYHPKETDMPTNGMRHAMNMALIRSGEKKLFLDYLKQQCYTQNSEQKQNTMKSEVA